MLAFINRVLMLHRLCLPFSERYLTIPQRYFNPQAGFFVASYRLYVAAVDLGGRRMNGNGD